MQRIILLLQLFLYGAKTFPNRQICFVFFIEFLHEAFIFLYEVVGLWQIALFDLKSESF